MKIGRYELDGEAFYGDQQGDVIYRLEGELDSLHRVEGVSPVPLSSVRVLAPVMPTKIIALGPGHMNVIPAGYEPPERPMLFFKPCPGTVANPGDPIVHPNIISNIVYELEIAIVIGKTATRVSQDKAKDYILGYTCCNDVTGGIIEEDWGKPLTYHWKAYDTFAPIGPVVATDLGDIEGLSMSLTLNGELKHSSTVRLIYSPEDMVSWISNIMTLNPGDIIATGAATNGKLVPGDVCTLEIEGIGRLTNPVIAQEG